MTNPGGPDGMTPGQWGVSGDGSIPAKQGHTEPVVTDILRNQFESPRFSGLGGGLTGLVGSFVGNGLASILGGFLSVIDAINGIVTNDYVADMEIITDHSQSLTEVKAALQQFILQGDATVFTTNGTYTPPPGTVSLEIIMVAAGAGGGGGRGDGLGGNRGGGGGGGGGGENHFKIPASSLAQSGGVFSPITIIIGAGGNGGAFATGADASPGQGGGNTTFGSGASALTATGGNGGTGAHFDLGFGGDTGGPGGLGGVGMIAGGAGGKGGGGTNTDATRSVAGGDSVSPFELYGGGGGGGGGAGQDSNAQNPQPGSRGGAGCISPGGNVGQPGASPSTFVASGAGGGGGGTWRATGGVGGYPGGGGGGGGENGSGAAGGHGILYVIARTS